MNTEQLLSLVRSLLGTEERYQVQGRLDELVRSLGQLASSPSEPSYQTEVAERLRGLEDALGKMHSGFTPAFNRRLGELGATPFFSMAMAERLRSILAKNTLTPEAVRQEAQELLNQRTQFIDRLDAIDKSLAALGFKEDDLRPGEAEIGFHIPRELFENELGGLARELSELEFIIRPFSEIAGHAGETIKVRTISTSDPLIFVNMAGLTILLLGKAIEWCLAQWKTIEEIRDLRSKTEKLNRPKLESIVRLYDQVIQDDIRSALKDESSRIMESSGINGGRKNEVRTHLEKSLAGLLARIERGMRVEIRLLQPPSAESVGEGGVVQSGVEHFEQLAAVRTQFTFPEPSGTPILKLAHRAAPENEDHDPPEAVGD